MILAAQIRGNGMMVVVENLLPRLQLPPFIPLGCYHRGTCPIFVHKKGEWLSRRPRMVEEAHKNKKS